MITFTSSDGKTVYLHLIDTNVEDCLKKIDEEENNNSMVKIDIEDFNAIDFREINDVMSLVHRKMRHGCKLIINGDDSNLLFTGMDLKVVPSEVFNERIKSAKNMLSVKEVRDILRKLSLKIMYIQIDGFSYKIECVRE